MDETRAGIASAPGVASYNDLCTSPGCSGQPAARCGYTDRRQVSCPTAWCVEHGALIEDRIYCRRHAGVIRAMQFILPAERDLPDLDNRAPALCEWIAVRCDEYITQLMQSVTARHNGSNFTVDTLHLVISGIPRVHAWEHNWRVIDHTGPLYTVALRVEEPRDSLVIVKVNGTVIDEAVPPWITERMAVTEAEDRLRRDAFDQRLLTAIYRRVSSLVPA